MNISDWLPMSPMEGPPLPKKFGIRWPWVKDLDYLHELAEGVRAETGGASASSYIARIKSAGTAAEIAAIGNEAYAAFTAGNLSSGDYTKVWAECVTAYTAYGSALL